MNEVNVRAKLENWIKNMIPDFGCHESDQDLLNSLTEVVMEILQESNLTF